MRTCPDVGAQWSDREVAQRWLSVFPKQTKRYARSKGAMENAIELMVSDSSLIQELRDRLCSLGLILDPRLGLTGRQVREGKRGRIPGHLAHILGRLEIEADAWVHTVLHFGKLFHRVAGKVQSILTATQRVGQKWLRGKPNAREVFG